MYVCVCKAVTERQIQTALDQGIRTRPQLQRCLDIGRNCGKCNPDIRNILNQHKKASRPETMFGLLPGDTVDQEPSFSFN